MSTLTDLEGAPEHGSLLKQAYLTTHWFPFCKSLHNPPTSISSSLQIPLLNSILLLDRSKIMFLKLFPVGALLTLSIAVPNPGSPHLLLPRAGSDIVNCGDCMGSLNAYYQAQGCWNAFVDGSSQQSSCIRWFQQAICMPCPVSWSFHSSIDGVGN